MTRQERIGPSKRPRRTSEAVAPLPSIDEKGREALTTHREIDDLFDDVIKVHETAREATIGGTPTQSRVRDRAEQDRRFLAKLGEQTESGE